MSEISFHRWLEERYVRGLTGSWRFCAANGALLCVVGCCFLILPTIVRPAPGLEGNIVAVSGALGVAIALGGRGLPGFWPSLLLGVWGLAGGIYLARQSSDLPDTCPYFGTYFALCGLALIALAILHRRKLSSEWEWLAVSAAMSVTLALVAFSRLPETVPWVFSIFLGLDFVFRGSALLAVALASNNGSQAHLRAKTNSSLTI